MRVTKRKIQFAICIAAIAEDDVEVGKVYQVLPDASATEVGCLRVIDESGEDYLYPTSRFVVVDVPEKERNRMLKAFKR